MHLHVKEAVSKGRKEEMSTDVDYDFGSLVVIIESYKEIYGHFTDSNLCTAILVLIFLT